MMDIALGMLKRVLADNADALLFVAAVLLVAVLVAFPRLRGAAKFAIGLLIAAVLAWRKSKASDR